MLEPLSRFFIDRNHTQPYTEKILTLTYEEALQFIKTIRATGFRL